MIYALNLPRLVIVGRRVLSILIASGGVQLSPGLRAQEVATEYDEICMRDLAAYPGWIAVSAFRRNACGNTSFPSDPNAYRIANLWSMRVDETIWTCIQRNRVAQDWVILRTNSAGTPCGPPVQIGDMTRDQVMRLGPTSAFANTSVRICAHTPYQPSDWFIVSISLSTECGDVNSYSQAKAHTLTYHGNDAVGSRFLVCRNTLFSSDWRRVSNSPLAGCGSVGGMVLERVSAPPPPPTPPPPSGPVTPSAPVLGGPK